MIRAAILLLLLAAPQQSFTQFTYCRANAGGPFESLCIQLDPAGAGEARFKRREGEELKTAIALSPGGNTQFLRVLAGTKYLANAKTYESKRKVADLGRKHLTLETITDRREADFNYSDMKDVTELVTFFEALITQEALAVDLVWAMKYDSLGIPERLDKLEDLWKQKRLADPKSLMEVLDLVNRDSNIVNYARAHAQELKEKIAAGK